MYAVSEAYKQAIQLHREYGVRNGWKHSIYLGQFDSSARNDAKFSVSEDTDYSDESLLNTSTTQEASYATFEGNSFTLDGAQYLMPTGNYIRQGFVSEAISNSEGRFDNPPAFDIQFGHTHEMVGITVLFDDVADIFASEYTVTTYMNGTVVASHTVANNTAKSTPELGLTTFDRMVIVFTKTNHPYQRIHVQNVLFGIGYSFDDEDIVGISVDRETSPVGLELPVTEISFDLLNTDGRFNVDADVPIVEFLKNDQNVDVTFSYDVSGYGDYEDVKLPRVWLKSWSVDGIRAKFNCQGIFSRYNSEKYETSTYGAQTAQELIDETMSAAGVSYYEADGVLLSEIATKNPLPSITYSECWQMIANLATSTLEEDEDGTIIFRYRIDPTVDSAKFEPSVASFTSEDNATEYDDPILQYATFEQDFFALDGNMQLMPDSKYENVGLAWNDLPTDGEYSTPPVITMEFEENSTAGAINLTFDEYSAPSKVQVIAYRYVDGNYTEVSNRTYEVRGPVLNATDKIDRAKRVVVKILGNKKDHRARLQRIAVTWDSGFEITGDDILGNPKGEVLTACRNAIAHLANLELGEDGQITKQTITAGNTVRISHGSPAADVNVTTEAEGATVTFTPYAYYTDVMVSGVSGDVEVVLTGKKLTDNKMNTATLSVSNNGEDCEIENPLLNSDSISEDYLPWIAEYLGNRVEWEVETLGYPELQPGDRILYKGKKAYVKRTEITTQSGSMRGKLTLRRRGYTN